MAEWSTSQLTSMFPHASRSTLALNVNTTPMLPREVIAAAGAASAIEKPKKGRVKNRTEAEYELILKAEHPDCQVLYEAYTLKLGADTRYTPDFALIHADGRVDFYETKGAYIFAKALVKPRVAATMFPQHRFFLAQKISGRWDVNEIAKEPR